MKADKKLTTIVAGLILKNNRLLCIRQDKGPYKGFIWIPAGHLESKESLKKGVVREVKEETGLDVKAKRLIMKIEYSSLIFCFYLCDVTGGKLSTKGEIKEIFWLSFDEILKSEKVDPHLRLIAYLNNRNLIFMRND